MWIKKLKILIINKHAWWIKEILISEKEFSETSYKRFQKLWFR